MRDFTGYILSGGKSSRMGEDKAFLKIREKTFLENAAGILKPVCHQTKVVINQSQANFFSSLAKNVSVVFDCFENRGALGGVQAALKDCSTEFAIILAIDLPLVTSRAIETLREIITQKKGCAAVVPVQPDGRLQPLCAVYRVKDCLPMSEEILAKTEKASMRDFLETINYQKISAEMFDESSFENINFPADYQKIKGKI